MSYDDIRAFLDKQPPPGKWVVSTHYFFVSCENGVLQLIGTNDTFAKSARRMVVDGDMECEVRWDGEQWTVIE